MFKLNDEVIIKKDSGYYDQAPDIVGVIDSINTKEDYCYNVTFKNNYKNCYRPDHIELYKPPLIPLNQVIESLNAILKEFKCSH